MEKYAEICQIGKGACGSVYLVRHADSKKLFALKKIQLDESRKTRTRQAVQREAKILAGLKHPHIVSYYDSFWDEREEHLCIIQDYCDGGTLEDVIRETAQRKCHLEEKEVVQIFLQIAMAVRYMHSKKVLHRDLKASNVFMNKSGTLCKIGDFGIAKSMDSLEVASTCVGTPCYLSPEMCQDIPYSSKADIWALGCMLYEMLALRPAFDANNLVSLFYKIVKGEFEPLPNHYSENMQSLVKAILVKSAEERPSARGVLAIPFLKTELLKFIEEKEFLLEQQRLPTRQGSRPYSTPNLIRLMGVQEKSSKDTVSIQEAAEAAKRARSCRPNIINSRKERSILISAKPSQGSRVCTIPEESEDQVPDKSRADSDKSRPEKELSASRPGSQKGQRQGSPSTPDTESTDRNLEIKRSDTELHTTEAKRCESPIVSTEATKKAEIKSPVRTAKTNFAKMDIGNLDSNVSKESPENNNHTNQRALKLDLTKTLSPTLHKETPELREFDSDPPKRHKIAEPMRTPRNIENHTLIIQTDPPSPPTAHLAPPTQLQAPPTQHQTPPTQHQAPPTQQQAPPINQQAPPPAQQPTNQRHTVNIKTSDSNKKGTQNILTLDQEQKQKSNKTKAKKSAKKEKNSGNSTKGKQEARKNRTAPNNKSNSHGNVSTTKNASNHGNKGSLLSVPSDKLDYYSDDFDESGSDNDSDIAEEIPEDIPGYRRASARSNSLTQTFDLDLDLDCEIPEIEEDLPDGLVAEDEDDFNDFEDDDIEEELDQVVMVAKRACDDLDSTEETSDEVIVDHNGRPNTSRMIRNQCLNDLGREKYDKVRTFFENNEEPEIKKIEKAIGKEHSKTIYLMTEIVRRKKLSHS